MIISIITPIYNESKNIKRYFDAILNLNYKKEDFEIIFINDGSKDNSLKIIEEIKENNNNFNIKIINFDKNKWRAIAREQWAKNAKYNNLLFLDTKCEIFSDALNIINNKNYSPIVWNALQKQTNLVDKFLYIIRKKLFENSFWEKFKDIYINKENFDDISKWTGILFIEKKIFLKNIPKEKGEFISDDTKLLRNIIKEKNILKTSDLKIYYNVREWFIDNIVHIYERWPKFIDFYYNKKSKYFWLINIIILLSIILIFYLFINLNILFWINILFIILWIYFSSNIKEFWIFILLAPILFTTFTLWLFKWIFLKITGQLWK